MKRTRNAWVELAGWTKKGEVRHLVPRFKVMKGCLRGSEAKRSVNWEVLFKARV